MKKKNTQSNGSLESQESQNKLYRLYQEVEYKSYGDYMILDQKNVQSITIDEDDDQFYVSFDFIKDE